MTPARAELHRQARQYVRTAEDALEVATRRLECARKILAALDSGADLSAIGCPSMDEQGPRAERAGARVDALMMAVHYESHPEDQATKPNP